MKLIPKNWVKFQHYKDRNPPWIKLHRDLLIDKEFMRLPLASKALAPMLWLLASEDINGVFDADFDQLEFRLRLSQKELEAGLKPLIDNGFFLDAITMLAPCLQDAIPETEKETKTETKSHEYSDDFLQFYSAYPSKTGKGDAFKSWKKERPPLNDVLQALSWQRNTQKWKDGYVPNPATYLNQRRWEDDRPAPKELQVQI